MEEHEDAYGRAMLDYLHGLEAWEIVEREDGFFSIGAGPELYFASHGEWRQVEREAISRARGRVLDVGCGAGRMMLHLREQGVPVTGIDISPAAIEACRRQGLEDVHVMALEDLDSSLGALHGAVLGRKPRASRLSGEGSRPALRPAP